MSNSVSIMKRKKSILEIVLYILLIALSLTCVYPLLWLLFNSVKTSTDLFNNPWGIGTSFEIKNYVTAWVAGKIGVSFSKCNLSNNYYYCRKYGCFCYNKTEMEVIRLGTGTFSTGSNDSNSFYFNSFIYSF